MTTDPIQPMLAVLLRSIEAQLAVLLRIEAQLAAANATPAGDVDLAELFGAVWAWRQGQTWDVAALKADGLIEPAQGLRLGQALGRLADAGGRCGPYVVRRAVTGGRAGNVWALERVGGGVVG
jgi:hypothetical protein